MRNIDDYQHTASVYDFLFSKALRSIRNTIRICLNHNRAKHVLDICCGTGEQLRIMASENMILTGVDNSPAMLQQARSKSPQSIHYLEVDGTDTGLPAKRYDGIIITLALHEKSAPEHEMIFKEACRLLHPRGHIFIADYCLPPEDIIPKALVMVTVNFIERMAGINHYHSYRDWMTNGALEGFLAQNNPGRAHLISSHLLGCVKLLSVSNIT